MKKRLVASLIGTFLAFLVCGSIAATVDDPAVVAATVRTAPDVAQVQRRLVGLMVPFRANTGQDDPRVAYTARTFAGTLFVTRDGQLVYSFPAKSVATRDHATGRKAIQRKSGRSWVMSETLVDARPLPRNGPASATHLSRLVGNDPSRWQVDVPTFESVLLGEAWPGIQLQLVARGDNVEKLFTLAPGADVRHIAIRLRGAKRLELADDGVLLARTGDGLVSFTAPAAWQDIDGQRRPVRVAYVLAGQRYGFTLGDYDRAHPVVIDPLLQATYLGGSGSDGAGYDAVYSLALDASGNVLVAGTTFTTDFPGTAGGAQSAHAGNGGNYDAFVAKLNNDLTKLIQATYLGGSGSDTAWSLALDTSGNVLVAGDTGSADFPGTAGGAQAAGSIFPDAFVAKLNSALTTLIQATYLGGSRNDSAKALTLDTSGNVFLAGTTDSTDFPGATGGAQPTLGGNFRTDAFVAKLNGALTTLMQASYLGGSEEEEASSLALDASGNVFVAGRTAATDFPNTAGGAQPANAAAGDPYDSFVAKLNNGLTTLIQATYLGGNGFDSGSSLALDASGNVFVAGVTSSFNFPETAGGAQPMPGIPVLNGDAFVAKLNNGLTTLVQATYLGGNGSDSGSSLVLDVSGNVLVAGQTSSTNFPGTAGGAQAGWGGGYSEAYVAKLNNGLTTLIQATYLGGNENDSASSLALDANGNVFVAGGTTSTDFPGTAGGAQPTHASTPDVPNSDGFVAKLTSSLRLIDPPSAAPIPVMPRWLLAALGVLLAAFGARHIAPRRD